MSYYTLHKKMHAFHCAREDVSPNDSVGRMIYYRYYMSMAVPHCVCVDVPSDYYDI
jgi:hypothetical protein